MILYNKKFEELVNKINKMQHMKIDIAVYMEITNNNDINLYIANNISHATYSIIHAAATCTTWRVVEGSRIRGYFNSERDKVDGERVMELYGVDDDELESDYTVAELHEKTIPRVAKIVSEILEERVLERIESDGYDKEGVYNIFWQSDNIGLILLNEEKYDEDYIKMIQYSLERRY